MTTLVHLPTGLQTPELEIMLSRAQQAIDNGEDVIVVGCPGGRRYACSLNIYGLSSICHVCKQQRSRGVRKLQGSFIYLESPTGQSDLPLKSLSDVQLKDRWAIKSLNYRSVDVGQAAYSSYVGLARDLDLEGGLARFSLDKLVYTAQVLSAFFFALLKDRKVTRVVLYNGRQNQNRPLLRVAQLLAIKAEVMEATGPDALGVYTFEDCLPQDLTNLPKLIERNWQEFKGDREEVARNYFEFKRRGGAINDRSYVLGQTKDLLPKEWDKAKRNIVIFNSSEDEFAAIGGEFDNTLYAGQAEAVFDICRALCDEPGVKVYLRIHPNLSNVKWTFARQLRELSVRFPHAVVVPPESPISTYAMLAECDVAVSFGSTVGIEAAYWGRPSILVGRCAYETTGSVYVPKSREELIGLLKDPGLRPLSSLGAKKAALFWSRGGRGTTHFGGTRVAGYTFMGQHTRKSVFEKMLYLVSKSVEKWIVARANYYLSAKRIGVTRWLVRS